MIDKEHKKPAAELPSRESGVQLSELTRKLAEAEAALESIANGQVDAVLDPVSATPILLRQAQVALQKSEARYRRLIESMSEGLIETDSAGVITYVNLRLCDILQAEPDALIGKKFTDLLDDPNRAHWLKHLEKRKEGLVTRYDLEITKKDGSRIFLAATGTPLFDEANNFTGSVGVFADITDRKQAEEVLKASEARLRLALDVSKTIAFEQDQNLVYTAIYNPHSSFSDEQVIGKTDADILPPESAAKLIALKRWVLDNGVSARRDIQVKVGQSTIHYDVIVEPNRDAQGRISGIICATTDITARKQAEQALKQNEALLRQIIDVIPQLIFIKDEAGRFVLVNQAGAKFGGQTVEEMTGHLESMWVTDREALRSIQAEDSEVINSGLSRYSPEMQLTDAHGQEHILQVVKLPIEYQPGQKGVLGVATDITQIKQSEAKLRASLAEKEVLLREVHHRVKNNLEVIISLATLQLDSVVDASAAQYLREMQERARAIALVHENLYQSRNLASVGAEKYLRRLTNNLAQVFGAADVHVRVTAADITLGIDSAIPLGLIVTELLTNAFKYAFPPDLEGQEAEPEIQVSLHAQAGQLILEVSDNGPGLPPDLDWQTADSLGLRLVNRLSQQLGGRLEVDPPPGTVFRLTFEN